MAAGRRMSNEVNKLLEAVSLEYLGPKLDALGVRSVSDLSLVDDADLVRWGLTTIERRRFFGKVRGLLGEGETSLIPPSALTGPSASKKSARTNTRPDIAAASVGPARLDELLGRGSAEHQVPRLAERVLAATGPLDVTELAGRLQRAAPALAQGYDAVEWPQFVEASVRGYKRLTVEEGVLQGDRPVVSICSSVLFSASEEVVADTACWVRVAMCLVSPAQVAVLASLCRASREVADGPAVWGKLLKRWYPKATLLNPDWMAQSDLEKRLEAALENDYALAALTRRLQPDTPYDIGEFLRALPQQTTPKALIKFMSKHTEHFRQNRDGKKFCVSRQEGDLETCKDWLTVNPFTQAPVPAASSAAAPSGGPENEKVPVPMTRPSELGSRPTEEKPAATEEKEEEPAAAPPQICQQLDPKQAFRLYHAGLLSQRTDQSKRGKLEAWEYYTESNSKCVMAAGDLLDLSESRVRSIRNNDPAVVHELVAQTLEGVVAKVPFGFWNRRVRVLTNALNASQLRVGREQRKKFERKLLEFMEWVKKERGFGYYRCEACGSRWKSGFSYEEISQQCLQCGAYAKPFRIQDLETKTEREAREKGEPVEKGKGRGGLNVRNQSQVQVNFKAPVLEHGESKRPWSGSSESEPKRWRGEGSAWAERQPGPPRVVTPPGRGGGGKAGGRGIAQARWPQQSSQEQPPAQEAVTAAAPTTRWAAGGGGFFARRRSEGPAPEATGQSTAPTQAAAAAASSGGTPAPELRAEPAPAAPAQPTYSPGSGGFFARRRAQTAQANGNETSATSEPSQTPAAESSAAAAVSASTQPQATESTAAQEDSAPTARYKAGGGGFFARRAAADAAASAAASADVSMQAADGQGGGQGTAGTADGPGDEAPEVPSDKLQALQELGLSLEEAVQMGLLPAGGTDAEG
mmetsp:Transcript_43893/g.125130  ORF Transcript_43893/g.125130 Transcript_43893/m.125130 type:complete len:921 (+) Transcript_43893:142-2904(+)